MVHSFVVLLFELSLILTAAKLGGLVARKIRLPVVLGELGAGVILPTSMDGDGTLAGYDLEFTRAISDAVDLPVVASGGAGALEHFRDAVTEGGAQVLLAASVFHFRTFSIQQVKEYLRDQGLSVIL